MSKALKVAYPRTPEFEVERQPDLEQLEGYLWPREGGLLLRLASTVPAGQVIVELGSFKGKSACYLARGSKAGASVPVYCVDVWEASDQEFARHFERAAMFADETIRETWERQIASARVKSIVHPIKGHTGDTAVGWTRPVGLLFVDADHAYEACRRDTLAWVPHLAPGAWIAWHDYGNTRFPGVARFVDEFVPTIDAVQVVRRGNLIAAKLPGGDA